MCEHVPEYSNIHNSRNIIGPYKSSYSFLLSYSPQHNKNELDRKPSRIVTETGRRERFWTIKWLRLKAFTRFIVFLKPGTDFVLDIFQKKPNITPTPVSYQVISLHPWVWLWLVESDHVTWILALIGTAWSHDLVTGLWLVESNQVTWMCRPSRRSG